MLYRRAGSWFRTDQAVLVVLGLHALVAACLLGWETFVTHHGRFLVPGLWPPLFFAAFVAIVMFCRDRRSRAWWRCSGGLLFGCYLSRAATLVIQLNRNNQWTAALGFGIATWTTLAFIVELLWVRVVIPASTNVSG
jgi:ABC-type amino acid transport system permease subunit